MDHGRDHSLRISWGKWSLNWRLFSDTSHSRDFHPSVFWSTEQTRPAVHAPASPLRKGRKCSPSESFYTTACRDLFIPFFPFPQSASQPDSFSHLCFCLNPFLFCTHCLILPSRLWPLFSSRQPAICKHSSTWLCCPIPSITSVHLLPLHSLLCCCIVQKSQKEPCLWKSLLTYQGIRHISTSSCCTLCVNEQEEAALHSGYH